MTIRTTLSRAVGLFAGLPAAVRRALLLTALLVGAVGVLALAKSRYDESLRAEGRRQATTRIIERQITVLDSVFVHDTVDRRSALRDYRARRDTLRLTDTLQVEGALAAADTVIVRDSVALADCLRRVALRDTLLRSGTSSAPYARLLPFVDVLYAPQQKTLSLRAGTTLRLTRHLALLADVEGPTEPTVRVGGRVTF